MIEFIIRPKLPRKVSREPRFTNIGVLEILGCSNAYLMKCYVHWGFAARAKILRAEARH